MMQPISGNASIILRAVVLAGMVLFAACAPMPPPVAEPLPASAAAEGGARRTIHVVAGGWHSGIVIARDLVAPGKIPEAADFASSPFLEFGWGDREYYPHPDPTPGMALAAALLPGDAAIRLAGLDHLPRPAGDIRVVELAVGSAGFDRMVARIDGTFDRGGGPKAHPLARRASPHRHFYPAHGTFHLFNTCNTWVADLLAAAGVGLSPDGVVTAGDLMERVRAAQEGRDLSPAP